jgi:hypothetical protein
MTAWIRKELQELNMLSKKWMTAVVLIGAAMSTTAFADERGVNTAIGAVVGAVIGNSVHGRDGAVVGGVLGAAIGASANTYGGPRYYNESRTYERPVVYAQPATYYRPAPAYDNPRPVYVAGYYGGHDRYYEDHDAYRHGHDRRDYDRREHESHRW